MRNRSSRQLTVQAAGPDTQNIRQLLPSTEQGRTAHAAKHPLLAGRSGKGTEQVGSPEKTEGGGCHRNIGGKRRTLCLAALAAVSDLNGLQLTVDLECHPATKTTACVHVYPPWFVQC